MKYGSFLIRLIKLSSILVMALFWSSSALARIGDSYTQCVQRYGEALSGNKKKGNISISYHRIPSGKTVSITYLNNKAVLIKYRDSGSNIHPHISKLLKMNSHGRQWVRVTRTVWERDGFPYISAITQGNAELWVLTEQGLAANLRWIQYQKEVISRYRSK